MEPIAVLADCMDREESDESASEYRQRALASVDHLAVVYARWADLADKADRERYQQLANDAVPQRHREDDFGPEATWLWRTMRAAEMTGLDTGELVRQRSAPRHWPTPAAWPPCLTPARERSWTRWSRCPRHRGRTGRASSMTPRWRSMKPGFGRRWTPGPTASANTPCKARPPGRSARLGRCPMTPVDRLDWQNRATKIATYRELYGSGDDPQVIGPEPTGNGPEMRAAWHDAFAASARTDCVDVRTLPDSSLMHMHDTYRALAPGLERKQRLAKNLPSPAPLQRSAIPLGIPSSVRPPWASAS